MGQTYVPYILLITVIVLLFMFVQRQWSQEHVMHMNEQPIGCVCDVGRKLNSHK